MYIPNIQKWVGYYDALAKRTHNTYSDSISNGVNQTGGSVSGSSNNFMVPIEKHSNSTSDTPDMKLEMVSPAQQDTERARSEMKRTGSAIGKRGNKKRKRTQQRSQSLKRGRGKVNRKLIKKGKKKRQRRKKLTTRRKKKEKRVKRRTVKKKGVRDIFA